MIALDVLSNINEKIMKEIENNGVIHIRKFLSFLKKGKAKRNKIIARIKKIAPPHAERDKARKSPAPVSFNPEILPLLFFMPETNRYRPIMPKNIPSGSDLNQPTKPRISIGIENANNNDAKRPAVVPPKVLTRANTAIEVKEPMTNGNNIVKV